MTKNRGQASLGKTVEPNGDSEIEIDDQEVDMKSDTSMKGVSDNSKQKRGIEAAGWKTEEDNETGFEAKRNKKGSNKRKGMDNHDSNGKKEPESNQSMKEKTKVREGGR